MLPILDGCFRFLDGCFRSRLDGCFRSGFDPVLHPGVRLHPLFVRLQFGVVVQVDLDAESGDPVPGVHHREIRPRHLQTQRYIRVEN